MNASADGLTAQLRHLLDLGHVRGALEVLNAGGAYRFTALYRLDAGRAENFVLIDRDDPRAALLPDLPLDATYCSRVQALAGAFSTDDAGLDPRLVDHPAREHVRAYCGVPLYGQGGSVLGTLCQFDYSPVESSSDTIAMIEEVASRLGSTSMTTAYRAEIDARVERLSDMKSAIYLASDDLVGAGAAFDVYADPLRDEARRRLVMDEALEVEAHISAIRVALLDEHPANFKAEVPRN